MQLLLSLTSFCYGFERKVEKTPNVMDRVMSISIISLDQNFNANDVDIMVFEPSCFLWSYLPRSSLGGEMTWSKIPPEQA